MAAILSREVAFFDVMVFWWFGGLVVVLRSCALVGLPGCGTVPLARVLDVMAHKFRMKRRPAGLKLPILPKGQVYF
jgi:hypothetical protein